MKVSEIRKLPKKQILDLLLKLARQNKRLKDSVRRLNRAPSQPVMVRHSGRVDDAVSSGWAERHGISIPRADGIHESPEAWVRVKHGIIVGAGLKNQSILLQMISLDLLDRGAEYHGSLYKDWRAAFFSRLDPTKLGKPGGNNPEVWSKEDRYSKLVHRLDKDLLEAMDGIVASRPKARHLAAFIGKKDAPREDVKKAQADFAAAFLQVVDAMQDINHEAKEAEEAAHHA